MITAFQSDKIKILSFIATILVLYIHSSFHSFEIDGMKINNDIQYIISGLIGRCAVPFFYIISGYLFFQKTLSLYSIYDKIRKRIRTLLVPYLIGCIFMAVFITLVCIIPMAKPYLNNSDLLLYDNSLLHIINSIFWDSGTGSPFAFHLWYIKDLLIIVLFSPLLYFAFLQVKHYLLLALWIAVFLFPDYRIITSTLWFCIGSYFALYPSSINGYLKKRITTGAILIFIIISIIEFYTNDSILLKHTETFTISLGILGIWLMYDFLVPHHFSLKKNQCLLLACQYSFFIYLFHEPTINVFRKIIVAIIGKNSMGYMTSYLLSPWITIITLILLGSFIKRNLPKIYYICTGNR